jgi:hypothetical protein
MREKVGRAVQLVVGTLAIGAVLLGAYWLVGRLFSWLTNL